MRIGEFAKKHDITQDTVRHYLQIGLLVPEKNGGHYKFKDSDCEDVKKIMELKQLDFSLSEIQKILSFQRLTGTDTEEYRKLFLSYLKEKNTQIGNELRKYSKMKSYVKDKIQEINEIDKANSNRLGLPISSLPLFYCPHCHKPLNLSEGSIESSMIINGKMSCECGYTIAIENGVYIDQDSVRKKTFNGKALPTKREYFEKTSSEHINFRYKGMTLLIDYINQYGGEPQYILELDHCVGFFLMQYIKYLPKNSTYILIDYDIDRITDLKRNLEAYHDHKNFVFLCCDYDKLPIKNGSIDLMVDSWATKFYARENNRFLLDGVMPLLKEEGLLIGSYPYYKDMRSGIKGISHNNYLNRNNLMEKIDTLNMMEMEAMDIGPIIDSNPYKSGNEGNELYQAIYVGEKISFDLKSLHRKKRIKESLVI